MHSNDQLNALLNYNNSRRPIKRITNPIANNGIYSKNSFNSGIVQNKNKLNILNQPTNKTGIATIFNMYDEINANNREKSENLISLNSNKLDNNVRNQNEVTCNCRDSKLIKNLREEIAGLRMKLIEKERHIRLLEEKNKKIEIENKNKILKKPEQNPQTNSRESTYVSSTTRNRRENNNSISNNNQDDIELAEALEKINEMERRQRIRQSLPNSSRNSNDFYRQGNERVPIINFQEDDIIDLPLNQLALDPFFSDLLGDINVHRPPYHNQQDETFNQFEEHIVNDLYPNPDSMTYEQLLELQEKVGHVQRGFSKQQIDKIPSIRFQKRLHKDNEKCTICQFDFNENEVLRKLNCGHHYHKPCVDEWLLKEKKCPVCNIEVILR